MENKKVYCTRKWLNNENSPSTGSVVCFDGESTIVTGNKFQQTFIEIRDCHNSVRLHKTQDDSIEDFKNKLVLLREEIDKFIKHFNQ